MRVVAFVCKQVAALMGRRLVASLLLLNKVILISVLEERAAHLEGQCRFAVEEGRAKEAAYRSARPIAVHPAPVVLCLYAPAQHRQAPAAPYPSAAVPHLADRAALCLWVWAQAAVALVAAYL